MCESNAYIKRGDKEELMLQDVARIVPKGDKLVLTGILGNQVEVRAEIVELDLMGHKILLKETP